MSVYIALQTQIENTSIETCQWMNCQLGLLIKSFKIVIVYDEFVDISH